MMEKKLLRISKQKKKRGAADTVQSTRDRLLVTRQSVAPGRECFLLWGTARVTTEKKPQLDFIEKEVG